MAAATSAATDTMFAAAATASLHAANADTASAANVTFAAGVQDAPIVPAPAIACAVATPRRSRSRVKNVATTRYLKKAAVLDCNRLCKPPLQLGVVQIVMNAIMPLTLKIVLYAVTPLSETGVTPLSEPQGVSPDVKASVASQIPEDFTAHLEMHPLRHIHHLATCTKEIVHHLEERKLHQVPSTSIAMSLQDIPQNTEGC